MYNGKFANHPAKKRRGGKRAGVVLLSLLLMTTLVVGGTLAYLTASTTKVVNEFTPSTVKIEIDEKFDGEKKTDVNVTNTGNIDAWVRVKLVTYRVNDSGDRIGGTAVIPEFTLGAGWVKHTDGMYYYTSAVAPNKSPAANLTDEIVLVQYDDMDGGKQVIEVIAEAIQAKPDDAVKEAWGFVPSTLK